jgi:hypothetical protein
MTRVSGRVVTGVLDDSGNLGVNLRVQEGDVQRVPLKTATLNVDDGGNIGIFIEGGVGDGSDLQIGNFKAGNGIKIELDNGKIKISVDPTVVDTVTEEELSTEEVDDIIDNSLGV